MNAQITVALISASASILIAAATFLPTKSKERSVELQQRKQASFRDNQDPAHDRFSVAHSRYV